MDHLEYLGGLFTIDGGDSEWFHWSTRSWTRSGIRHSLHLARQEGMYHRVGDLICNCEDFTCRRKHFNIFERDGGCKHARALWKSILEPYFIRTGGQSVL